MQANNVINNSVDAEYFFSTFQRVPIEENNRSRQQSSGTCQAIL